MHMYTSDLGRTMHNQRQSSQEQNIDLSLLPKLLCPLHEPIQLLGRDRRDRVLHDALEVVLHTRYALVRVVHSRASRTGISPSQSSADAACRPRNHAPASRTDACVELRIAGKAPGTGRISAGSSRASCGNTHMVGRLRTALHTLHCGWGAPSRRTGSVDVANTHVRSTRQLTSRVKYMVTELERNVHG